MKIVAWHTKRREWARFAVAVGASLSLVHTARSQEHITATEWAQRIARADAQIELHPDDPSLYADRGVSELWLRQYDEAIADFTRAIQLKPDRWYYASRGDARSLACDSAGAAEDREKEAAFQPESTRTYQLMLEEVSALRRLPFLNPVPMLHRNDRDLELMAALELDGDAMAAGFHGEDLTYERLGIAPKGFSMRKVSISPRSGAYYDNVMQAVFFGSSLPMAQTVAHELTHALQDQNFSTAAIESARADNSDALFAFETLEEGDAMALGSYWQSFYPDPSHIFASAVHGRDDPTRGQIGSLLPELTAPRQVAPSFSTFLKQTTLESWIKTAIDSSASPRSTEAFADLMVTTPQGKLEWVLPLSYTEDVYVIGPPFIEELRKRGGWERVNAAYGDIPRSSTQVLHPQKYLAGEMPVEIELPDVSGRLGQRWRRIRSDTLGEYSYAHIFDLTLPNGEKDRNTIAAAGWRGDRYSTYEGPRAGDVCMIQASVWDTEQDAREFFEQYEQHILHRYRSAKAIPQRSGAHVWTTNEGGVFLDRQGRAVLIAEGVPESADRKSRAVPAERPGR